MYAATLFRSRAVGKGQGDWFVTGGRPSRAVALRTWTPSCNPRVVSRIIRRVPRTARHQGSRVPPGIAYIKDHVFRIGFVLADLVCCYEIEILAALVSQKALFGSIRCASCVAVG